MNSSCSRLTAVVHSVPRSASQWIKSTVQSRIGSVTQDSVTGIFVGKTAVMNRLLRLALLAASLGCALALVSCAMTEPVVVIGKDGHTLKGTATASLSGGQFSVSDGQLTCRGSYDSMNSSPTIEMQTLCSDGRKGIVISTRQSSGVGGHGTVKLNDGSEWTFIFGPAAANF